MLELARKLDETKVGFFCPHPPLQEQKKITAGRGKMPKKFFVNEFWIIAHPTLPSPPKKIEGQTNTLVKNWSK